MVAADMQHKFHKLLATPIKEEIIESTVENDATNNNVQAESLVLRDCISMPHHHKWTRLHSPLRDAHLANSYSSDIRARSHNTRIKKSRSTTTSPTTTTLWRHRPNIQQASEQQEHNKNGFPHPPAADCNDSDEHSSSSSVISAISLTMKTERHNCDDQEMLIKHEQQNNNFNAHQQHQKQQYQHHHRHQQQQQQEKQHQQQQNQQYLDELKQTAVNHQQQLTANLFMARTIALSRSRDFPELFPNSSVAAVAAAAAVAAVNSSNSSSTTTSANYMLPCPLCETPLEQRIFRQHLDRHYPRDSPVCPVIECGRRFAHPNSVRNHMRIKHTLQWAKMKAMRSSGGPFASGSDFK